MSDLNEQEVAFEPIITSIVDEFINNYNFLKKAIETFNDWLDKINPNIPDSNNNENKTNFLEEIREKNKKFLDSLINIFNMNNSNLIEESKNKLIILLDEIINFKFFPPTQPENNIKLNLDTYVNYQMNNDEQNISQNRQNFIQQFQEDSEGEGQKY